MRLAGKAENPLIIQQHRAEQANESTHMEHVYRM
jgi:hypothetical protein